LKAETEVNVYIKNTLTYQSGKTEKRQQDGPLFTKASRNAQENGQYLVTKKKR
jgi:hypothetical protein